MKNEIIRFQSAAEKYLDAIPVGNGRLGAMICGGVQLEKINLNDDTLWSGFPRANYIDCAYERFTTRLRKKILEEDDLYGAEDLADRLQGPYNESYIPAGEMLIEIPDVSEEVSGYVRGLDIKDGVAFVEYTCGGVKYKREAFASFPDDVIVIRITADKPKSISFCAHFESMIRSQAESYDGGIKLFGRAPRHIEPQYLEYTDECKQAIVYDEEWELKKGLRFECHANISAIGGEVLSEGGKLTVKNADEACIYIWVGTNYNKDYFVNRRSVEDYCIKDLDISSLAKTALDKAMKKGFEKVYGDHVADMNEYYDRVSFEPEYDISKDRLFTEQRKALYEKGEKDAGFEKQLFDFGRYLLYSCSREGSQAANLQGIWCWEMRPAWSCNYTININTQMNYWGVETAGMPECHMPLMELLDGLSQTGKDTASSLYGARGFCAHHNVDLWRAACPVGLGKTNNMWAIFTVGGIWLSLNVWEHYLFTRDAEFLKQYYHVLKGAALFAIDMMGEMKDGHLGMVPTAVPERRFKRADGVIFAVGAGSTFDYELVTELFDSAVQAAEIVNDPDKDFVSEMEKVRSRFPDIPISKEGTIKFWQFDAESSPYMWSAKLYGLYPGYCLIGSEKLYDAAKLTLEKDTTPSVSSFGNCWYAGAWARAGRGDKAYEKLNYHISNAVFTNLLGVNCSYPDKVFQIDSNLGIISSVIEMLVQSTPDSITLLPALSEAWQNGSVKGIKTRCGCTVDIEWKNGKLEKAVVYSPFDQEISVVENIGGKCKRINLSKGQSVTI